MSDHEEPAVFADLEDHVRETEILPDVEAGLARLRRDPVPVAPPPPARRAVLWRHALPAVAALLLVVALLVPVSLSGVTGALALPPVATTAPLESGPAPTILVLGAKSDPVAGLPQEIRQALTRRALDDPSSSVVVTAGRSGTTRRIFLGDAPADRVSSDALDRVTTAVARARADSEPDVWQQFSAASALTRGGLVVLDYSRAGVDAGGLPVSVDLSADWISAVSGPPPDLTGRDVLFVVPPARPDASARDPVLATWLAVCSEARAASCRALSIPAP